ncbi:MAG: hypothetical protein Q9227_007951 [Pyrenula ochraceoflavens]
MHFLATTLATVLPLLSLPTFTLADGCFSGGNTWSSVTANTDDLASMRMAWCSSTAGTYTGPQIANMCFDFAWSQTHVDFVFETPGKDFFGNGGDQTISFSKDECNDWLTTEMNACEHGSKHTYNQFTFRADPQEGLGDGCFKWPDESGKFARDLRPHW